LHDLAKNLIVKILVCVVHAPILFGVERGREDRLAGPGL
jgi:hypothetical protein